MSVQPCYSMAETSGITTYQVADTATSLKLGAARHGAALTNSDCSASGGGVFSARFQESTGEGPF